MAWLSQTQRAAAMARRAASGEGVACLQAEALEDHRRRTEAGERRLQQVEADEGREVG
jgi:hypothetical protein